MNIGWVLSLSPKLIHKIFNLRVFLVFALLEASDFSLFGLDNVSQVLDDFNHVFDVFLFFDIDEILEVFVDLFHAHLHLLVGGGGCDVFEGGSQKLVVFGDLVDDLTDFAEFLGDWGFESPTEPGPDEVIGLIAFQFLDNEL